MTTNSAIGTAPLGARSHSTSVALVERGQQQQRGDQPDAEQQQRDAGDPLGQPMLAAFARRAEAATLPSGVALRRGSFADSQHDRPTAPRSASSEPTSVIDREALVGAELEARAGVHHQVADAGQQMLEEGPGQADQDDQPEPVLRAAWRSRA